MFASKCLAHTGNCALIKNLIEELFNEIVLFSRFSFRGAERLYHALYFDYIFLLKTESLYNAILAF